MFYNVEDLFDKLARKYGEDFNWSFIPFTNKYFIEEAKREIKEEHPLYGELMYSIIKCDSNDDVIAELNTLLFAPRDRTVHI